MSRSTSRGGVLSTLSTRAYGVAFLLVLATLLGLSVATFQKRFTPVVSVTLLTDRIGNQLQAASDVKVRGLIVGEVREISTTGDGARVELALDPAQVGSIPAGVSARLLPKTLFGERYVDLVLPSDVSGRHIREGDVIPQDRSSLAIELEQVFSNLLPLLQTVKPEKLSATLNALATSLEGRGERLGQNAVLVDTYLTSLNPHMPALQQDISGLADVASLYADAAPDLLRMARNLSVTNTTIVQKQSSLAGFFAGTTGFANTATTVLSENEDRIIRLGDVSRPTLDVLEKYAPEYPCLLQGLDRWRDNINGAFGPRGLHIKLEVVQPRPAYRPGEEPRWRERRGPRCYDLPNPRPTDDTPFTGNRFDDGTRGGGAAGSALPGAFVLDPDSGLAGTPAERQVTSALFAPMLGVTPQEVPTVSTLLLGPLVRGTQVGQR